MTVVLVPGFMTDPDLWRDVADALAAFGPIVHADLTLDASIRAMARRALEDTPGRFHLVGFSMGGYVAREIVRIAPDRVTGLVLIATSARGATEAQARRARAAADQAATAGFRGISRAAIVGALHPDGATNETLVHRIAAMGQRLGGEVFRRQSLLERVSDLDQLHNIGCPTLIVAGAQDRLRSLDEATELHDGIAGSRLAVIDGAGHMVPMEAPHALGTLVAHWLAEAGSAQRCPGSEWRTPAA